ncbi:MAG TPA: hypothetical protein DCZ94_01745 [Lentisphaeria bacterium]|nr:MAG: hypothetical protein A2X48_21625 [Lentisphaerae bacterium GWF2_49_21]HBC85655.1 hypothetical protein [Lentisphaeria bacterium]
MDGTAPAGKMIEWQEKMKESGNPNQCRLFIHRKTHHLAGRHDWTKPVKNDIYRQTELILTELGYLQDPLELQKLDSERMESTRLIPRNLSLSPGMIRRQITDS